MSLLTSTSFNTIKRNGTKNVNVILRRRNFGSFKMDLRNKLGIQKLKVLHLGRGKELLGINKDLNMLCRSVGSDKKVVGSDLIDCNCEMEGGAGKEGTLPCHNVKKKKDTTCDTAKHPKYEDEPCQRICLPCCKPATYIGECTLTSTSYNKCVPIKYKYPSFAQSVKKYPFGHLWISDCCYWDPCCERVQLPQPLPKPLLQAQRDKLGFSKRKVKHFSTFTPGSIRQFTTGAILQQECLKGGGLPCLKRSETVLKKIAKSKKTCDRLCMPCCPPARDPPDCHFPYEKQKCLKYKAPRASFSECQDYLRDVSPCECIVTAESCSRGKSKDEKVGCYK